MIAKLKLGGMTLALFASLFSASIAPAQLPPEVVTALKIAKVQHSPERILQREKAALSKYLADKYAQPLPLAQRIVQSAYREADNHGLPPLLVLAVIEKESSLRPTVQSSYGATGLMQVVPRFHGEKLVREKHPDGLKDPETNIRVGSRVLAEYLARRGGNEEKALEKYSGGARRYAYAVQSFRSSLKAVRDQARMQGLLVAAHDVSLGHTEIVS